MKTVLITGANKSIGFETAKQMAKLGYYVFVGSRDIANGEEAVAKLKAEGVAHLKAIPIDVNDAGSIVEAKNIVSAKGDPLDVLINNAGISGGFPQNPSNAEISLIRRVFDTNFFGAIEVTQVFLELLKKSPAPRIVNVTSGLASLTLHSDPDWKYVTVKGAAYGPSKTALNAYTVALAWELRETPFKVNVVDPGYTATDFNHHRGPGTVEEAAALVVKYATIGSDGPTGKFFSNDIEGEESPW